MLVYRAESATYVYSSGNGPAITFLMKAKNFDIQGGLKGFFKRKTTQSSGKKVAIFSESS
jgi:hypothetical protein